VRQQHLDHGSAAMELDRRSYRRDRWLPSAGLGERVGRDRFPRVDAGFQLQPHGLGIRRADRRPQRIAAFEAGASVE
jgi:hypothetical protein